MLEALATEIVTTITVLGLGAASVAAAIFMRIGTREEPKNARSVQDIINSTPHDGLSNVLNTKFVKA